MLPPQSLLRDDARQQNAGGRVSATGLVLGQQGVSLTTDAEERGTNGWSQCVMLAFRNVAALSVKTPRTE
jgi:hypothetical protein